ncbi:cytochrome P450, partial [Streptomyces sp. NPDC051976]|uniref:cytochrome P450 n=1 Tax=Streptomyces sp. NPDC051976 TaxID=3154947 RepID=UPI00342D6136
MLVQACDATGTLVEHAEKAAASCPRPSVETAETATKPLPAEPLLTETLRHDPPVHTMRRVAAGATRVAGMEIAEGDLVLLDVAAANRDPAVFGAPAVFAPERSAPPALTFGAAPRVCPGRDQRSAPPSPPVARFTLGPSRFGERAGDTSRPHRTWHGTALPDPQGDAQVL